MGKWYEINNILKRIKSKLLPNALFYIVLSIVSFVSVCFAANNRDSTFFAIILNISCSALAASLMALFVDWNSHKREQERIKETKRLYFKSANDRFLNVIGHLLWLDARMNDKDFDWDLPSDQYFTLHYMLSIGDKYPVETISYKEAKKRKDRLRLKYSLDGQSKMSSVELKRVQKLFCIVVHQLDPLVRIINKIIDDELTVSSLGLLSLEQINDVSMNIQLAASLMKKPGKNYGVAIDRIFSAYEIIRNAAMYEDMIEINVTGLIPYTDL